MSSSDTPSPDTQRDPLSPLEGGKWRPLKPEELLRREPVREDVDEGAAAAQRQPPLERRQELERFIKDRPADMEAYLELAAIYRRLGRSVEATRVLKAALEVEPQHPEVLWQLEEATLARALQQLRDVREVAQRVSTPEANRELERAQIDWACRRVDVCRERLVRDPQAHRLRVVLAEALRDLGEFEEALAALAPAMGDDTEGSQASLVAGQCLHALGRKLEALAALRRAATRRAVTAPARLRASAMRLACDLAESLGLNASLEIYRRYLQQAEAELQSSQATAPNPMAAELFKAPPNPPPASQSLLSTESQRTES